jgi:hypothetical protein
MAESVLTDIQSWFSIADRDPQDPEVERRLKVIGCPYGITDPQAIVWLDGYGKAILDVGGAVRDTLHEALGEPDA